MMAVTWCPRAASHAAISPVYLPVPVSSGAKLMPYRTIFMEASAGAALSGGRVFRGRPYWRAYP